MNSASTYGFSAVMLAVGAWLVVVGVHAWTLPRGSFALLRELRGEKIVAFGTGLFLSLTYSVRAVLMLTTHAPMGSSAWAKICRPTTVLERLVLSEIFLMSAYAVLQKVPAAGFVLWLLMMLCATLLAPTAAVTMAKAESKRKTDEAARAQSLLDHADDARRQTLGAS